MDVGFDPSQVTDADLVERCRAVEARIRGLLPFEKQAETDLLTGQLRDARDRLNTVRETLRQAYREGYQIKREISRRLGRRLRTARLEKGLTATDVAKLARCSVGFVTWIEQGKHPVPGPDFFAAVCSEQGLVAPFDSPMARLFGPLLRNGSIE